ncbi:MAG: VOC family protein [Pseudomonadota bacterium]
MSWMLHHVNIPTTSVRAVAAFYRDLLGLPDGLWAYPDRPGELHHDSDSIAYFGSANRGLHIVRPIPTFPRDNGFHHNPTIGGHSAFTFDDLAALRTRLDAAGVTYSDAGTYAMAGVHQLYFYDPDFNVVEANVVVDPAGGEGPGAGAAFRSAPVSDGDWSVHHVSQGTANMAAMVTFYSNVLGLGPPRMREEAAGHGVTALFGDGGEGLHLKTPVTTLASEKGAHHNPSVGRHVALRLPDLDGARARLADAGHALTLAQAADGRAQVYVYDPAMTMLELTE